ncbi:MAG: hypothetical protein D6725_05780 [Planctomycetota bacterium]|nr:MAG: hypothetical protein D6725_05780 [Planctomycetota bacterium]
MLRSYRFRQILGYFAWLAAALGLAGWLGTAARSASAPDATGPNTAAQVTATAGEPTPSTVPSAASSTVRLAPSNAVHVLLRFEQPVLVRAGDPVQLVAGESHQLCGYVYRILSPEDTVRQRAIGWTLERAERPYRWVDQVELLVFLPEGTSARNVASEGTFVYCAIDDSLLWVVEELLTPQRRKALQAELERAFQEHGAALFADLQPVASLLLQDLIQIAEQDGPTVLQRHHAELQRLSERYRKSLVEQRLIPLVQSEVFPIVRKHAEPVVWQVGREIWERVRVWSLVWRFVYDRVRAPEQKLLDQELQRFVDKEVVPILKRHTRDFIAVVERTIVETATNEKVQQEFSSSLQQIGHDPELHRLLVTLGRELFWENPRARERLRQRLNDPQTRAALQRMARRIEQTSQRIGQILFGTLQQGITPEFASVLRRRILQKDRRWFEWRWEAPQRNESPAVTVIHPASVEVR